MSINLKATLAGAGKGGTYYTGFVTFSVEEIREHVALYVFHGISPSPMIDFKFRYQHKYKVHGNYFIHRSFGPNAKRHHKHFKAFFSCQNPAIDTPDRSEYPNWKGASFAHVDEFHISHQLVTWSMFFN